MIFGTGHNSSGSVRRWTRRQAMIAMGGVAAMALLAGCGGGGSGGGGNSGGGGGGQKATLTGRILDVNNGDLPVQGVIVNINGGTAVSGADGNFTLLADPIAAPIVGTLVSPKNLLGADAYYRSGYFNGVLYDFVSEGFPVQPIQANESRNLGTFKLGSTEGPPFPPKL